jgi:four helix bundle protein
MRDHNKLRDFELAHEITVQTYKLTKAFPEDEIYGLTSQLRRSAISVPSSSVEGCARESQIEYMRFLEIDFGSLRELHYQFSLAVKLGYIGESELNDYEKKIIETVKVLASLIRVWRKSSLSTA